MTEDVKNPNCSRTGSQVVCPSVPNLSVIDRPENVARKCQNCSEYCSTEIWQTKTGRHKSARATGNAGAGVCTRPAHVHTRRSPPAGPEVQLQGAGKYPRQVQVVAATAVSSELNHGAASPKRS
jgi:hypothetical protein